MARSSSAPPPTRPAAKSALKPTTLATPAPAAPHRYFVRCTFVGEEKKIRVEGSFRFIAEAADIATLLPKLEKAVRKLRRTGELPPRCEVFVEFMVDLLDLKSGVLLDFERWERNPRRFQRGCTSLSDTCPVIDHDLPTFRFGAERATNESEEARATVAQETSAHGKGRVGA